MSVLPLVFPDNMSCFSRGSYKVVVKMMVLAMIQIFLIMTMIMILRRSWREKDSYQFLRCLARVGSSQDQRTMYQVLIIFQAK